MAEAYIVTGGAGFVGANLVATLLGRTPRPHVVVIDSFRSGSFANLVEACQRRGTVFDGDVIAAEASQVDLDALLEATGASAVFHLGAITDTTVMDQVEMLRCNLEGFAGMLAVCASRSTPLVYASSAATYGTPPQAAGRVPFPVEAAGRPSNIYGFSKWLMECEHRRFSRAAVDTGKPPPWIVGLRYFNVFGPGEGFKGKMASMVHQLCTQMLAGKRPRIFADGSQARDQIFVEDVVECTMAAAGLALGGGHTGAPPRPGVYNLGSGVATSFNDIITALRQGLGLSEDQLPTEHFEMPGSIRSFYQDYTCADMSETEQGLRWRPRWRVEDAIAETAAVLKGDRPGDR
jgi:ADP-L-glycero-D-manno-heptose 6-epimerase